MGMIFDDKERTYLGASNDNEGTYAWLDRSASKDAEAARERIENMYAAYPDSSGRLLKSLRHPDGPEADNAFHGALASLLMHERLKALGFEVATDEDVDGHHPRPDLIAQRSDVGEFVVEVTVMGQKQEFADRDWLLGQLTDAINNGVHSDAWRLTVRVDGDLEKGFDPTPVIDAIAAELETLPVPVTPKGADLGSIHRIEISIGYATCEIGFLPISAESLDDNDADDRIIWLYPARGGMPGTERRLRGKLKGKHPSAKGIDPEASNTPYVIAVGLRDVFASDTACRNAIWGDEAISVPIDNPEAATPFRIENGAFGMTAHGAKNAQVSGVLFIRGIGLEPFKPGSMKIDYYENPHALVPFDPTVLDVDRVFGVVDKDEHAVKLDWIDKSEP